MVILIIYSGMFRKLFHRDRYSFMENLLYLSLIIDKGYLPIDALENICTEILHFVILFPISAL
ncbi:MAG: hypothetical protein DJ555_05115 [Desulfurococcaceae archaeon]|nr:MAG: hypothetical protein DJ555_05115 [Desulfurococcaceae archaeon]